MTYEKQFHVIFKIQNDDNVIRDYCRDEPPLIPCDEFPFMRFANENETINWANEQLKIHKLHSFEIQHW